MLGKTILAVAAACAASAGNAQAIELRPLIDARIRWEDVDQRGLPKDADAVTLRVRSGVAAAAGGWSALVESEATVGIVRHHNDGLDGRAGYPTVGDPQNIELNRAQLRYATPAIGVTIGRQLLEYGDQRFVGSASFRQNQQTYDAASATLAARQSRRTVSDPGACIFPPLIRGGRRGCAAGGTHGRDEPEARRVSGPGSGRTAT